MKKLLTLSAIMLALASSGTSNAETITVSPANPVTVTAGNANNYVFETDGVLTISAPHQSTFSGTYSGTGGTINYTAEGRAQVRITNSLADFGGAINIGGSSWFVLSGANTTGSANAVWTVNTTDGSKDTGLLIEYLSGNSAANPIKLGKLEGDGFVRTMSSGEGPYCLQVGGLLTNATDTSIFSGSIRLNGDDKTKGTFTVEKIGAGTWILTGINNFTGGVTVTEGKLQMGNTTDLGSLASTCPVTVSENGTFGYKRNASADGLLYPKNKITVNGGTLFNAGTRGASYSDVTFNGGGKVTYETGAAAMTFEDLTLAGDVNSVLTIDNTNQETHIGKLTSTGTGAKEIAASGVRGKFLYLDGDVTGYTGKISSKDDFWISLNEAKDCSTVCFNLNSGLKDSGLLLWYTPTEETTLKIGSLEGNGIIRPNAAGTYKVQVGANNDSTTFSGGFQKYGGGDFTLEKVGTGTWTITSDSTNHNSGVLGNYQLNNFSGSTTITAGTLQLGIYDPVTKKVSATGQMGSTKFIIGENGTLALAFDEYTDYFNEIESNNGTIQTLSDPANTLALRGKASGSIIKTGQGALGIGADNGTNLTQITVKEGILRNWGASRLGNGSTKIVLDGGTFLEVNNGETISNPIVAASTGSIQTESMFNYSGVFSGTGTVDISGGTVILKGDNSAFTGTLSLVKGVTTVAEQKNVGAAAIEFDGGQLTTTTALSNTFNVSDNGGKLFVNKADLYFSGKVTGNGELVQTSTNRGTWFRIRDLDLSEFSGTLTEKGDNWISLENKSSAATTWNLANTSNSGLLMQSNKAGTVYQFGNLTGTGYVRTHDGDATYTIEVGAKNEYGKFSGAFRKDSPHPEHVINVTKVGTETWTLASADQSTGYEYGNQATITVKDGTLELARKAGQASAIDLKINENGALLLSTPNQTITGAFSALAGATIQVDTDAFASADYKPSVQKALLEVSGTPTVSSNVNFEFLFDEEDLVSGFEQNFGLDCIISGYTVPEAELLGSLENYKLPGTDVNLLMPLYGEGGAISGVAFNSEGVPEPASWILLVLGALGLYGYRRKR